MKHAPWQFLDAIPGWAERPHDSILCSREDNMNGPLRPKIARPATYASVNSRVKAKKLEPTRNQSKKETQDKSAYIRASTCSKSTANDLKYPQNALRGPAGPRRLHLKCRAFGRLMALGFGAGLRSSMGCNSGPLLLMG